MDLKKPSYRSIVCEEVKEQQEFVLHFSEWNNIVEHTNTEQQETRINVANEKHTADANKMNFLNGFADFITDLTMEIKEHYGFHGIANDITVDKVIDCFDNSVVININEDSNTEFSSDDDETFS